MKNIRKNILLGALVIMTGLTSCFEEKDDDYTIVGAVASVSVFSIPNPLITGTSNYGVTAGEQVNVAIRYYSEHVKVTQYRVVQDLLDGAPATILYTKDVTDFDIRNSYVDVLQYTVPAFAVGKKFKLTIEIETENSLVNKKDLPLQVK
jgi:hypothetical protein